MLRATKLFLLLREASDPRLVDPIALYMVHQPQLHPCTAADAGNRLHRPA